MLLVAIVADPLGAIVAGRLAGTGGAERNPNFLFDVLGVGLLVRGRWCEVVDVAFISLFIKRCPNASRR